MCPVSRSGTMVSRVMARRPAEVLEMEDAKQLIQQAFEQAKASGKPDWHRMTTAVLKNRLLSLTGNAFHEAEYDASTFASFVQRYEGLVHLDRSSFPPIVELRDIESVAPSGENKPLSRPRVRSDLWLAALDYSSKTQYVWDSSLIQARQRQDEDDGPVITVVTQAEFQRWRREFMDEVLPAIPLTTEQSLQVDVWFQRQLPTSHLPRHLIHWFDDSGLAPPSDLLTSATVEQAAQSSSDTEELRQLVLRVVRGMTEDELEQLNLPSRAVLRISRSSRL